MRLFLYINLCVLCFVVAVEKIRYLSLEHPAVTYLDKDYVPFLVVSAKRYGRANPVYYVNINFTTLMSMDNNIVFEFYIFEFLTNVYKRSFVQVISKFCDLLEKDIFFGAAAKYQEAFKGPCPYPPNNFVLTNMTIPPSSIPSSFPFRKGRIMCNVTRFKRLIVSAHIDMELKELRKKDNKITFSTV